MTQLQHNATAGRSRIALAQGDVARAMLHVESLLSHRAAALRRAVVLLSCHQVLARWRSTGGPGGTVKLTAKLPKRPDRMGNVSRLRVLSRLGKLVQRERKAVTQHQVGIWECTFVNLTVPW
jgi:hypothetical protein